VICCGGVPLVFIIAYTQIEFYTYLYKKSTNLGILEVAYADGRALGWRREQAPRFREAGATCSHRALCGRGQPPYGFLHRRLCVGDCGRPVVAPTGLCVFPPNGAATLAFPKEGKLPSLRERVDTTLGVGRGGPRQRWMRMSAHTLWESILPSAYLWVCIILDTLRIAVHLVLLAFFVQGFLRGLRGKLFVVLTHASVCEHVDMPLCGNRAKSSPNASPNASPYFLLSTALGPVSLISKREPPLRGR